MNARYLEPGETVDPHYFGTGGNDYVSYRGRTLRMAYIGTAPALWRRLRTEDRVAEWRRLVDFEINCEPDLRFDTTKEDAQ